MSFSPSMISQISGIAGSTIGGYYNAQSQQSALKAQAKIADTNARILELSAQSQLLAGQKEVARYTMAAGQKKSTQKAALAANGVDLGVGSAAETTASTDIIKEIDKNQITANAVRSAWGLRTQAVNYQNEALIKRATAGSISPFSAAATSLLGGASAVADSWYRTQSAEQIEQANSSSDPIYALGTSKGWW